jgi:hypothetical protein
MSQIYIINELPYWIRNSVFVYTYINDFPDKNDIELEDERVFEFSDEITDENIEKILDNIRFFGIEDKQDENSGDYVYDKTEPIRYKCFCFLAKNKDLVENLKSLFPELDHMFKIEHIYNCESSVRNGNLFSLKYARENGCDWNEWTCLSAARYGHLECLKYAHENGCPWDEWTCLSSVANGHLECLKYAHENGCPWGERTCKYAVENGQLECLKYAREYGCPLKEDACRSAARSGQLECLKYLHENGCP